MSFYNLLTKGLREPELSGHDGPYLMMQGANEYKLVRVNGEGDIITERKSVIPDSIFCTVQNEEEDSFTVSLKEIAQPISFDHTFPASRSTLVISDIEGNFNALYGLLLSNEVIDLNYNWTFGNNDLVILGDVTDKGENVTQCLWLIYHLEHEARSAGGRVHYLLGNHEVMDICLDLRYVHEKYLALAQRISHVNDYSVAYHHLLEHNNVLTNWVKNKNCVEKIGDTLFVHAGISPQLLQRKLNLKQINWLLREHIHWQNPDELCGLLMSSYGPIWYRGLVSDDHTEYDKAPESFVDKALDFYEVERIVVGHTIVDHVSADYHGKVIRTDVLHAKNKFSDESQALLIENNKLFRVDALGKKESI